MIDIYAKGMVHCSICTDMKNVQAIEAAVNAQNPTGIASQWKVSEEKFADGSDNPHQCEDDAANRHYLMVC